MVGKGKGARFIMHTNVIAISKVITDCYCAWLDTVNLFSFLQLDCQCYGCCKSKSDVTAEKFNISVVRRILLTTLIKAFRSVR